MSTEEGVQANIEPEERCPISAAVTILFFQKRVPFIFPSLFFKKRIRINKCMMKNYFVKLNDNHDVDTAGMFQLKDFLTCFAFHVRSLIMLLFTYCLNGKVVLTLCLFCTE